MALQPYGAGSQALAVYGQPELTEEEIEKRAQDAEILDKKLRHIVEDVPDRTYHIMGSNAGAGSGDFHTYRHGRRREQERLQKIEEDYQKQQKDQEYEEKLEKLREEDEEKTAKRRAKRQKKKENQKSKKQKVGDDGSSELLRAADTDNGAAAQVKGAAKGPEKEEIVEQPDLD